MGHAEVDQSVRQVGAAMGEAIGIFMLHPETFGESIAAGYANPSQAMSPAAAECWVLPTAPR